MNREQAQQAAATFQAAGWDVVAQQSPLDGHDYELAGRAANGDCDDKFYGFSHNDMKTLVLGGQIKRKT